MNTPKVSLVIPCRNEEHFIHKCLMSIIDSDFIFSDTEILVIDGQSNDKTVEIVSDLQKKYSHIKLFNNSEKTVPYAMNIGIEKAQAPIIIRLDAHAEFPKNYITELLHNSKELQCDNIGASIITLPANHTRTAQAIALSNASSFGIGNSQFRLDSAKEPIEVDTVPFGCYKKEVFDRIGLYDTDLTRNQDDELNARLIENGGSIYLLPHLKIKYFARASYTKMYDMFYQYGYFKPLVNLKLQSPATLRQFVPPIFVLFLILGSLVSLVFTPFTYAYIFGLSTYFFVNILVSLKISKNENKLILFPFLLLSFFLIHIAYGLGYWTGILDFVIRKKHKKNKINIELSR